MAVLIKSDLWRRVCSTDIAVRFCKQNFRGLRTVCSSEIMTAFGAVPWLKYAAHGVRVLRLVSCLELGSVAQRCCWPFWCTH